MGSPTDLKKLVFVGGRQCICQGQADIDEAQAVRPTSRNTGMFWISLLCVILKNRSLTEIDCWCKNTGTEQPRRQAEVAEACSRACTKTTSVSVCGWQYLWQIENRYYLSLAAGA